MLERLARQIHSRRLRELRTEVSGLRTEVKDLMAERGSILSRLSALRAREPGMLKRIAAGARTAASVGIAVVGGLAAYQLGQDSSFVGQMAGSAVSDKSFAAADVIGRGGPRTVAQYDELIAALQKRLDKIKVALNEANQKLNERTAALKALRATDPLEVAVRLIGHTLIWLLIIGIVIGFSVHLYIIEN